MLHKLGYINHVCWFNHLDPDSEPFKTTQQFVLTSRVSQNVDMAKLDWRDMRKGLKLLDQFDKHHSKMMTTGDVTKLYPSPTRSNSNWEPCLSRFLLRWYHRQYLQHESNIFLGLWSSFHSKFTTNLINQVLKITLYSKFSMEIYSSWQL